MINWQDNYWQPKLKWVVGAKVIVIKPELPPSKLEVEEDWEAEGFLFGKIGWIERFAIYVDNRKVATRFTEEAPANESQIHAILVYDDIGWLPKRFLKLIK
jgi:hypothetical protein